MIHTLKLNLIQHPARMLMALAAFVMLFMGTIGFTPVAAQNQDLACEGVGLATGMTNGCSGSETAEGTIGGIIQQVVRILILITGAVAIIMVVWGGFRYIISGGDSNAAAAAKKTIIFALVGLVIVIFAQIIITVVANTANEAAMGGITEGDGS